MRHYYKILWIFLLTISPIRIICQTIEFELPSCHHLQYYLALKEGNRLDTVAIGRLDEHGKATVSLPDKYASYRGVGNLSIPFCKNEGINIILNREEKISLKEKDGHPEDIVFLLSDENIALQDYLGGKTVDSDKSLYATQIYEILVCLMDKNREKQKDFIVDKLDFKDLYTSGFWNLVLELYYEDFSADDTLLLKTTRLLLDKTEDIPVRRVLTQSVIRLFSKYGKDNLLIELGAKYLTIPINGKPAPLLRTESIPIKPKKCLLFFYDSQCGLCHNEMHQLRDKYELLSNDHNQIEIITISGDTDKEVYEDTIRKFPWKTNLFDGKGLMGENFENYGIVGTPTLILIDEDGIIRGRYMCLNDFLK